MNKIFAILFCFSSTFASAQNGFFLQPEIGAGISNTNWKPSSTVSSYPGQSGVLSYQGQMDIGYKAGKWQFISGIGHLRTGVHLKQGSVEYFNDYVYAMLENAFVQFPTGVKAYDPHIIVPVKIGYELHRFSPKLSLTPFIGGELTYNMPRTFVYAGQADKESKEGFNYNCNKKGVTGLLQLNFDYRLSNRYDVTFGPSVHYMFTSELNFKDQHDYSVLMNLGLKWNFKRKTQAPMTEPNS